MPCTMYNGIFEPLGLIGTNALLCSIEEFAMIAASFFIVGYLNKIDGDNLLFVVCSICIFVLTAINDVPPRSKKSSFTPILLIPILFSQISIKTLSSSDVGAAKSLLLLLKSGSGKALV